MNTVISVFTPFWEKYIQRFPWVSKGKNIMWCDIYHSRLSEPTTPIQSWERRTLGTFEILFSFFSFFTYHIFLTVQSLIILIDRKPPLLGTLEVSPQTNIAPLHCVLSNFLTFAFTLSHTHDIPPQSQQQKWYLSIFHKCTGDHEIIDC